MSESTVLYRIKPTDKKSIEIVYEAYKERHDGSIVGWSVKELYRWGQGFVESEDELPYIDDRYIGTDPNVGDSAELEDHISVDFDYDEGITDEEKTYIELCWLDGDPEDPDNRSNVAWLYDYSDWQIESENITIYGPFEVDKLTYVDYNIISEERVELKPRPPIDKNSAWPFK